MSVKVNACECLWKWMHASVHGSGCIQVRTWTHEKVLMRVRIWRYMYSKSVNEKGCMRACTKMRVRVFIRCVSVQVSVHESKSARACTCSWEWVHLRVSAEWIYWTDKLYCYGCMLISDILVRVTYWTGWCDHCWMILAWLWWWAGDSCFLPEFHTDHPVCSRSELCANHSTSADASKQRRNIKNTVCNVIY